MSNPCEISFSNNKDDLYKKSLSNSVEKKSQTKSQKCLLGKKMAHYEVT